MKRLPKEDENGNDGAKHPRQSTENLQRTQEKPSVVKIPKSNPSFPHRYPERKQRKELK
jgi:hypothetical protein